MDKKFKYKVCWERSGVLLEITNEPCTCNVAVAKANKDPGEPGEGGNVMEKKSRLAIYLEHATEGGFGWVPRYECSECEGQSVAWLSGHYRGMLDELIEAVGIFSARRIVDAQDAIRARENELRKAIEAMKGGES